MAERTLLGFHNPVLLTAFGTQKGRKTVSFLCPSGFRQTLLSSLECMAGTTGLEPATSAVTGQRSDQLSYVPRLFFNNLGLCHIESSGSQLSLFSLSSTISLLWTQFRASVDTKVDTKISEPNNEI